MARQARGASCCLEARVTRLIVRRTSSTGWTPGNPGDAEKSPEKESPLFVKLGTDASVAFRPSIGAGKPVACSLGAV